DRGFAVLGFPCNQFASQEPGDREQIARFCKTNFGVTFPIFDKINVNGDTAHPLYRWLKKEAPGVLGSERIKWNFTKFLIDREGRVAARFAPTTKPEELKPHIERLLGVGESRESRAERDTARAERIDERTREGSLWSRFPRVSLERRARGRTAALGGRARRRGARVS